MTERYTKNTITATAWCRKCHKFTVHRVDAGRLGPCMPCIEQTAGELKFEHADAPEARQGGLFEAVAAAPETMAAQPGAVAAAAATSAPAQAPQAGSEGGGAISREFAQACRDARFDYRGYGVEGDDRVYSYSRPGAPEVVFRMRLSRWDRTVAMLEREARRTERWLQ